MEKSILPIPGYMLIKPIVEKTKIPLIIILSHKLPWVSLNYNTTDI